MYCSCVISAVRISFVVLFLPWGKKNLDQLHIQLIHSLIWSQYPTLWKNSDGFI